MISIQHDNAANDGHIVRGPASQDKTSSAREQTRLNLLADANKRWGIGNLKGINIDQGDVDAALAVYILGPDVYKKLGHNRAAQLAKPLADLATTANKALKQLTTPPDAIDKAKVDFKSELQMQYATQIFLNYASLAYGDEAIKRLHIDKTDYAAAYTAYTLGPDIYGWLGHDNSQHLGRQTLLFGVAPIWGACIEGKKQITTNFSAFTNEAALNGGCGFTLAALAKLNPPVAIATGTTLGIGCAYNELCAPENQVRNLNLTKIGLSSDKLNATQFTMAFRQTSESAGQPLYHFALATVAGGAAAKPGHASAMEIEALAASATTSLKGKLRFPTTLRPAYATAGVRVRLSDPYKVNNEPSLLMMSAHHEHEGMPNRAKDAVSKKVKAEAKTEAEAKTADQAKTELNHDSKTIERQAKEDAYKESLYQKELATGLVRELQAKGHIAVFVGGSVRDELMGFNPKDYDIATSATPDQIDKTFQELGLRVVPVGRSFGVMNVIVDGRQFEVATLRVEGDYQDGRRPGFTKFVTSLRDDAARRDLTINSLFKDPLTGTIYDFFGGQNDIRNRIIKAVGDPHERFSEDKLRMLRVPRFFARYDGFTIDADLLAALKARSSTISSVSGERLREEIKGILTSKNPVQGLQLMMSTGLMKEVLPEVYRLRGPKGRQDPLHHPEKTTWTHTKMVLNQLAGSPFERMLGGLLHDVGKPDTQVIHESGKITNFQHERVGADIAAEIAKRINLTGEQTNRVVNLVELHMLMHSVQNMRPGKVAALLERPDIMDLIELEHADAVGRGITAKAHSSQREFLLQKLEELKSAPPTQQLGAARIVGGNDLKDWSFQQGQIFSSIIDSAHDAQREGEFNTIDGAKKWVMDNFGAWREIKPKDQPGKIVPGQLPQPIKRGDQI